MFFNMTTKAYVIATALVALMTAGSIPLIGLAAAYGGEDEHSSDRQLNLINAGNGGNGGHAGDGGNGGDATHCGYCKGGNGGQGGDSNGGDGGNHNGNKNHQTNVIKDIKEDGKH